MPRVEAIPAARARAQSMDSEDDVLPAQQDEDDDEIPCVKIAVIGGKMTGKSSLIRAFNGSVAFDPRRRQETHQDVVKEL